MQHAHTGAVGATGGVVNYGLDTTGKTVGYAVDTTGRVVDYGAGTATRAVGAATDGWQGNGRYVLLMTKL